MVCHCLFKKGILYLVGIFLLFNVGCKLNSNPDEEHKDSITILYYGDERIFLQDYSGMEAVYWIFQPLVKHSGDEKGEIEPVLAESWIHSDDYRTWTVKLRRDIFWHDGVQMTANDVKFTIDLRTKESGIKEFDCEMLDWAHSVELPVHVLLTKSDKLSNGPAGASLQEVLKAIHKSYPLCSAQLFSSLKKQGIKEARQVLTTWLYD